MMDTMKLSDAAGTGARNVRRRSSLILFAALLLAPVFASGGAELAQIRAVYLLPMGTGLDQYLANQLTMQDVLQVVTDPDKADAIFTDQIGEKFEMQLEKLYPPPPVPEEPKVEKEEEGSEPEAVIEESEKPEEPPVRFSTFSRGKGNVFLVSRESRHVIWSIYQQRKSTASEDMNRSAERIVRQLKDAISGK